MELNSLKQPPFNTTLMGVIKGVLDYYGIEASNALTYGGTGHAFLINIHEELCPSGPYCWKYEGFYKLLRNLGLEMTDLGFFHPGNSPEERERVERTVRDYLDQGLACSLLNDENQLIYGYDDTHLLTARPWPMNPDFPPATLTLGSWQELGKAIHITFFVFRKLPKQDDLTIAQDGLRYAMDLFRTPENYSREHYGIGLRAYENWIKAAPEHGASHGNWWNATVWSECRAMAADYFSEIAQKWPGKAAGPALELSAAYRKISDLLSQVSRKDMAVEEKVRILQELQKQEASAVQKIGEFSHLLDSLHPEA